MKARTYIVTGASSGVGAASVQMLMERGARVVGLDIQAPGAAGIEFVRCDVGDADVVDRVLNQLPSRLSGLVNCAALPGPRPEEQVLRVNFLGLRHLCQRLFPRIEAGGSIVNIASVAGRDWQRRAEVVTALLATAGFEEGLRWCQENAGKWAKDPYTFSKQCVVAYTMQLAGTTRARGVRSNSISPGGIDTAMTPAFRAQIGHEQFDWSIQQLGRQAQPAEIAEVVSLLSMGPCSWLNGADVVVDGGYLAGLATGWIDASKSPAAIARARRAQETPDQRR